MTRSRATPRISAPFGELCWAPRKWEIDFQSLYRVRGFLQHKSDLSNFLAPSLLGFLLGSAFWFCLHYNLHICNTYGLNSLLYYVSSFLTYIPIRHQTSKLIKLKPTHRGKKKKKKYILNFLLLHRYKWNKKGLVVTVTDTFASHNDCLPDSPKWRKIYKKYE